MILRAFECTLLTLWITICTAFHTPHKIQFHSKLNSLASSFDPGLPAGLRGEAVRSCIRNPSRGIWYDLKELDVGILSVEGGGTLPFLQNKLTNSFEEGEVVEACLLTSRGRAVDKLTVAVVGKEKAFIVTGAGHGSGLYERLDPLVFPLDKIVLKDCSGDWSGFCVGSTTVGNAEEILRRVLSSCVSAEVEVPRPGGCVVKDQYMILDGIGFPKGTLRGYTILTSSPSFTSELVSVLSDTDKENAPLQLGPLEYQTLRIECGLPSFKNEMSEEVRAGPLELHLDATVDFDKGCYLGQEGVVSIMKNVRGVPQSLYQVVFYDEDNEGERQPRAGDELTVLGSNKQIKVGVVTSVAEPGGTGELYTMALALVRRPGPILQKMKQLDLDVGYFPPELLNDENGGMEMESDDPLHDLEVIIKGTDVVGRLKPIPSRRLKPGRNLFDSSIQEETENKTDKKEVQKPEEEDLAKAMEEAKKAAEEAEAAALEAKRKAEKMEMLKKRAEAAMAARKKKKMQQQKD